MSTQQLGKIGLVFLAVYLVVSSLSSIPSSMGQIWSLGIGSAGEAATAAVAVDIRLARFACGHHIGRAAESQRR